ncbi:unnamed protein product [Somion occarium]|uniref:DNA-directed DNA polymerase n=1 Tax=Somion occarium TaxID=3059160 RepID=A0ABP1CXM1_9APHY
MYKKSSLLSCSSRLFHGSASSLVVQRKVLPPKSTTQVRPTERSTKHDGRTTAAPKKPRVPFVKRNELGVQMLSRKVHEQIFRNVSFPVPDRRFVQIAKEHLKMHGLDPSQGSVLPDITFTLPPLQGRTLDEHFHRIGSCAAEPWLTFAKEFTTTELPPAPEIWQVQSGWTKYLYHADGSSYCIPVEYPAHEGVAEQILVFDVETMPAYSPYAIMATCASKNAWYSWISPWLLEESTDPQHLIPVGDSAVPRIIVGHNVSYDRGRILEEYNVSGTKTRFLDTMALHVAVKGISSHQRPAWMKYRKQKQQEKQDEKVQKEEAVDAVLEMMRENERLQQEELDAAKKDELRRVRQEMEESLPQLQAEDDLEAEADLSSKRWEDLTSANSLADVAKLHCGISMDKEARSDFMTHTPAEIRENIQDYLNYCSTDVAVTHAVYSKAFPAFLQSCPSPVSFAGILTMGSAFLTVNEEWEKYIANAERTYRELEDKVRRRLIDLAHEAKDLMEGDKWKDDVWLSQLDWTPKVAGKSRGVFPPEAEQTIAPSPEPVPAQPTTVPRDKVPGWYKQLLASGPLSVSVVNRILPFLLRLSIDGHPVQYSSAERFHYVSDGKILRPPTATTKTMSLLGATHGVPNLRSGRMQSSDPELSMAIASGDLSPNVAKRILNLATETLQRSQREVEQDPWLKQLDWKLKQLPATDTPSPKPKTEPSKPKKVTVLKPPPVYWPKWYWDLAKPNKDTPPGTLDLTVRNRFAPLLLRLSWQGWPLYHSREHGWTFRVSPDTDYKTHLTPLTFYDPADERLQELVHRRGYTFYKLPHKDGEKANVGSPLGKNFIKYAQDGTLTSPGDEAKDALDMNAQCSYWISARDRVMKQVVVWQDKHLNMGFPQTHAQDGSQKWGMILPQVITMGTVTRRAIEKTWLTASNAKKNRVGSELKAMVRAPPGYAIVGADVDSEELWISSAMGDAQFGLHGATAIGWMTLEGTKAAGTDLHSKTASILGISRDQAKVFNYSRIYGAGMRHAVLLLLQSNAGMLPEQAQKLAENLYASTKGKNTHRSDLFGRKFWFGGTESFVFNKLEEIALSDKPQTPALGCGITYALSKEYLPTEFGSDYMTSRINWVVQSSGVDYLHLLIVSMDHLITKYNIQARYLISVHDEVRYLVKEEDRYRAALALQIANVWTRSLFAYKLGMDDLPQGVAFFSAVDVDHVLRKEVDMPCVTPSQPVPIPPGESLDIAKVLEKTNGGSLWPDGSSMEDDRSECGGTLETYKEPDCLKHRASNAAWLRAQATSDFAEVKHLAQQASGRKFDVELSAGTSRKRGGRPSKKSRTVGSGEGVDWDCTVDELLRTEPLA